MAFGKSLKKTQKATSEVAPKAKASVVGTKARAAKAVEGSLADDATAKDAKSRLKSAPAANLVSTPKAEVVQNTVEAPKTMAAAAGMGTMAHDASNSVDQTTDVGQTISPSNGLRNNVTMEAIAQRAYQYWVERGYAHGFAEEDWSRAEAELIGR